MAKKGSRSASFGSPLTLRPRKRFEDHITDLTTQSIKQSLQEIEAAFESKFGAKTGRRPSTRRTREPSE